jgi:hypothetical protein
MISVKLLFFCGESLFTEILPLEQLLPIFGLLSIFIIQVLGNLGISPQKLLLYILNFFKFVKFPISDGIGPLNSFL